MKKPIETATLVELEPLALTAGLLGAVVHEGQSQIEARLAEIERRILAIEAVRQSNAKRIFEEGYQAGVLEGHGATTGDRERAWQASDAHKGESE